MTPPLGDPCGTGGEAAGPAAETAGGAVRSSGSTSSRPNKKRSKPATAGKGRWTKEEHADFLLGLERFGKDWQAISELVKTRTHVQTRTHHQKYEQQVKKGRPFPEEPYENIGDSPSTSTAATTRTPSSSSPPSSSSSPSGAVRRPPATVSAATIVRGKRLTRPPPSANRGDRGGGSTGPRSTRARAAAAASRAAAAAGAGADDNGRGGLEGGGGGRGGKRLKIERSASAESAASAFGQQQQQQGSGVGVVTPPMGGSGSPAPCSGNEASLVKSLWSAVGGMDGSHGGGGGDVADNGGGSGISIGGLCSRQLSPILSEGFLEGFLAAETGVVQASPPTSLSAARSPSSSSSLSSSTSFSACSSSTCSSSPLPRIHGSGGDKGGSSSSSLNRNEGSQRLRYLGEGVTTGTSSPMHDGHRLFQQQQQQQQQYQRLRQFQQQQQQRFMSAAAAATAAATASSMSPLYGGFAVFGGGGQMDAFAPSTTGGGVVMPGVEAFGCPPALGGGPEYTTTIPAMAAAAHASAFGSPIDANPAALSLEPSPITIPGIGIGGVGLCGYSSGFGGGMSGSSSGSDGGGQFGVAGAGAGAALLPPGSESSSFSYRSGCGGGGVWRDTLELAGDVGGLHDGRGVGLPSPLGMMVTSGQQQRAQQSEPLAKQQQQQQQQMGHRFRQNHNVPPAVDTHPASPSLTSASSGDIDVAAAATATTGEAAERAEPSPGPSDDSDSGNPYDALVIDVDNGGDGIPLADNWMGLETIVGGGELEAWQNKGGDEQFDFLAVFAFEDHFGML